VTVAWRPNVGHGPWGAYATSPGSFAVTAGNAKAITALSFQGLTPPVTGVIDEAAHTIVLTVPRATDVHALVATFTTTGESVTVGPWTQISGVTANDFTSPVTYKVTAFDGSTQDYVVTVVAPVAVGDAYGGGVVAYILQPGDFFYSPTEQRALIAASADQPVSGLGVQWATKPYLSRYVPGATGTFIGTGSFTTDNIVRQNGPGSSYAAGLARAYRGGGYSDWYLPSRDELDKLYRNRAAIGGFVTASAGYPLYWSSSEYGVGQAYDRAWFQDFGNGGRFDNPKSLTARVRAVRSLIVPLLPTHLPTCP